MDNKKLLQFAFEFEKAPEAVKSAAAAHHLNTNRMDQAELQFKKWADEFKQAKAEFQQTEEMLIKELSAWTPDGSKPTDAKDI